MGCQFSLVVAILKKRICSEISRLAIDVIYPIEFRNSDKRPIVFLVLSTCISAGFLGQVKDLF